MIRLFVPIGQIQVFYTDVVLVQYCPNGIFFFPLISSYLILEWFFLRSAYSCEVSVNAYLTIRRNRLSRNARDPILTLSGPDENKVNRTLSLMPEALEPEIVLGLDLATGPSASLGNPSMEPEIAYQPH